MPTGQQLLGVNLPVNARFPFGNVAQIGADVLNIPSNAVNKELGYFFNDVNIGISDVLYDVHAKLF